MVPRQIAGRFLPQPGRGERIERGQRHAGRGRGQSDERALGPPRLREVEPGQPDRGRHDVEVAENPLGLPGARELELIDDEGGRDAEAHDVHQAVELPPEPGPRVGKPRHPPVQRVQDAGEHDIPPGAVKLTTRREYDRPDAEEQVEEREQARHDDDDAPHSGTGEPPHGENLAVLIRDTPRAAWRPRGPCPPPRPARRPGPRPAGTHPPATRTGSFPAAPLDPRGLPPSRR